MVSANQSLGVASFQSSPNLPTFPDLAPLFQNGKPHKGNPGVASFDLDIGVALTLVDKLPPPGLDPGRSGEGRTS